jgi:hypothetical protein
MTPLSMFVDKHHTDSTAASKLACLADELAAFQLAQY